MDEKADIVRIYLPPSANSLRTVTEHCLRSRHYVNATVASKRDMQQWLSVADAQIPCPKGIGIRE